MEKIAQRFLIFVVSTIVYFVELVRTQLGVSNLVEHIAVLLVMLLALIIVIKGLKNDD